MFCLVEIGFLSGQYLRNKDSMTSPVELMDRGGGGRVCGYGDRWYSEVLKSFTANWIKDECVLDNFCILQVSNLTLSWFIAGFGIYPGNVTRSSKYFPCILLSYEKFVNGLQYMPAARRQYERHLWLVWAVPRRLKSIVETEGQGILRSMGHSALMAICLYPQS